MLTPNEYSVRLDNTTHTFYVGLRIQKQYTYYQLVLQVVSGSRVGVPAGRALHEITLVFLQVVSGSRVGVPAGRALYQLNDRMTGEERALARRECALFMDADGFVSPAKLYVWFATGTE